MKIAHSRLQTLILEEISSSDVKPMFDKLISQLGELDKSIDFLAAAVTGMDPFDIDIAQNAYGRFALPQQQSRVRPPQSELKENTEMKLTSARIRQMVTEVLGELSEEKWAQEAAEDIEKKGTEGEFTKYCGGNVTQGCVDKAARGDSTKRKRQAAFAANINSSDDLTYPKEKKKKE